MSSSSSSVFGGWKAFKERARASASTASAQDAQATATTTATQDESQTHSDNKEPVQPTLPVRSPAASPAVAAYDAEAMLELKAWKHKDVFQELLSSEYDEASYVTAALEHNSDHVLDKLTAAGREIEDEIHTQVSTHHVELLNQSEYVEEIEQRLQAIKTRVSSLQTSVHRVKSDLLSPFAQIRSNTRELSNIQQVTQTVAKARQVLKSVRKLRDLKGKLNRPTQGSAAAKASAQLLADVEAALSSKDVDLSGIHAVQQQRAFVASARRAVAAAGQERLWRGMDSKSQDDMTQALTVFFHLGQLNEMVDKAVERTVSMIRGSARGLRDHSKLGGMSKKAKSQADSSGTKLRTILWQSMRPFSEELLRHVNQICDLQRLLDKKTHQGTQVNYLDHYLLHLNQDPAASSDEKSGTSSSFFTAHSQEIEALSSSSVPRGSQQSLLRAFWKVLCAVLRAELDGIAKESSFVKSVFVNEFPRLHQIWTDFITQASRRTFNNDPRLAGVRGKADKQMLLQSIQTFQHGFLSRKLATLQAPVKAMFASTRSLPTHSDMTSFAKEIESVLEEVQSSAEDLQTETARMILQSVRLFIAKCESQINTTNQARFPTPAALKVPQWNGNLFGLLCELEKNLSLTKLRASFPNIALGVEAVLRQATTALHKQSLDILRVMVDGAAQQLIQPISAIHKEDFGGSTQLVSSTGSKFVQRLQRNTDFLVKKVLPCYQTSRTPLERRQDISNQLAKMGTQVVRAFLLHAALVYPLSENGKMKLLVDLGQLQRIMSRVVPEENKEDTAEQINQFKTILSLTTEEVLQTPLPAVDHTLLAIHLFSRHNPEDSGAQGAVLSPMPHKVLKWSAEKYFKWVQGRSEVEVLQLCDVVAKKLKGQLKLPKGSGKQQEKRRREYIRKHYPAMAAVDHVLRQRLPATDD